MNPIHFEGQDVVLGQPADWDEQKAGKCGGLPIKRTDVGDVQTMISFWRPSEEDIANILAGHCIQLTVFGFVHPPVGISVEPVAEKT